MFHFFSRKNFLIDYLEGFIDMHNHILPGIDDGAKNVTESIELIKGMGEFGVTDFICTPHIMHNYYPNTSATINDALLALKNKLLEEKMKNVSIQGSAEHMIDDNFEKLLENGEVMPLGNDHLLIEMSYLQPSINFEEAIIKISSNNYFTILAHPERYIYLHDNFKKHETYKKQGLRYQLNFLSLSKFYGKEVQRVAFKLLENEMIDYVASDVHNVNQLNSLREIKLNTRMIKLLQPVIQRTNMTF